MDLFFGRKCNKYVVYRLMGPGTGITNSNVLDQEVLCEKKRGCKQVGGTGKEGERWR